VYVFIVPTNAWVYFGMWLFSSIWTMMIHDRVRLLPDSLSGIINHTGCHTAHHWFYRHNYGNYFTFWDRACGTYFDPDRLPQKFFAVKSSAKSGRALSAAPASALPDRTT
jgi:lathosterol oxidase